MKEYKIMSKYAYIRTISCHLNLIVIVPFDKIVLLLLQLPKIVMKIILNIAHCLKW